MIPAPLLMPKRRTRHGLQILQKPTPHLANYNLLKPLRNHRPKPAARRRPAEGHRPRLESRSQMNHALQKLTIKSTHARRGAPGAKNVTLCAGALPAYGPTAYAGYGIVSTVPCAEYAVFANCAAV